jgi:hypothetical protein
MQWHEKLDTAVRISGGDVAIEAHLAGFSTRIRNLYEAEILDHIPAGRHAEAVIRQTEETLARLAHTLSQVFQPNLSKTGVSK